MLGRTGELAKTVAELDAGDPKLEALGEARACPDWAMKRVMIAESIESRREMLERDLPRDLDPDVRKMIVNFAVLN